jgi:uncharacterized membrane protein YsdA (DUF1294 family)
VQSWVVLAWAAVASGIGLALMTWDKRLARRQRGRIRERTLLLWALLGAWPGVVLGAILVRHKTRKPAFLVPLAVVAVANLVLLWAAKAYLS